jgi:hypothetical protein
MDVTHCLDVFAMYCGRAVTDQGGHGEAKDTFRRKGIDKDTMSK